MFQLESFEDRLLCWSEFRNKLEDCTDPFTELINFYQNALLNSNKIDAWNIDTWPTAWELVYENRYCSFLVILGYYYTLVNTNRFQNADCSILVLQDNKNGYITYRLKIENNILGYDKEIFTNLPKDLCILHEHTKLDINKYA